MIFKVASIDDKEELDATDSSFDILGFDQDEKNSIYRITAGIMHSGNMIFKQKPREEQAENDSPELTEKAGFLLGKSNIELIIFEKTSNRKIDNFEVKTGIETA